MSTRTQPQADYLDLNKFAMYAEAPGVTNKAKLVWGMRNTDPRITVFVPKAEGSKSDIISAPLGVYGGMMLLEGLSTMVDAEPGTKSKVECRGSIRDEDNKPTGETTVFSEVWYGKDKEGYCWISVISNDTNIPRIKFIWSLWNYHKFFHASTGEPYTGPEASCLMLKVAVEAIKAAYHNHMTSFSKFGSNITPKPQAQYKAPDIDIDSDIEF